MVISKSQMLFVLDIYGEPRGSSQKPTTLEIGLEESGWGVAFPLASCLSIMVHDEAFMVLSIAPKQHWLIG
jgi:hypothetical protein